MPSAIRPDWANYIRSLKPFGGVVDVDPMLTVPSKAVTTGVTTLQPLVTKNVDHVDRVDHFLEQQSTFTQNDAEARLRLMIGFRVCLVS